MIEQSVKPTLTFFVKKIFFYEQQPLDPIFYTLDINALIMVNFQRKQ